MAYRNMLRRLHLLANDDDGTLTYLYRLAVGLVAFLGLPFAMACAVTMALSALISGLFTHAVVLSIWLAGPLGGWGPWWSAFLTPTLSVLVWVVHATYRDAGQVKYDPKYEDARRYFFN